ncbi:hypothetical protein [Okeania sp. KiyG1]|nr:hypothetical protein [Okeania sp. KiyG1]
MSIENGWMRVDINNLVFVDESGVNLGMTRLYGLLKSRRESSQQCS